MRSFSTRPLRASLGVLLCGTVGACMVGPNYHRPAAPTSPTYKEAQGWAPANPSDAADRADWWTAFGDPTLNDLEKRVAISNQNLAASEAAYRQAVALVAEQRAALFPTVSLTGSLTVSHGGFSNGSGTTIGGSATTSSYNVGAGASWAPDLWGGIRRSIENAKANAQASDAQLADARLSAQMELATDYVTLRQLDEEKRILDATVTAYARSLAVTENKYKSGVAAKSDVLTAQTQLASTQASDADLVQQRAKSEHAIALLVGQTPASLTLPPAKWALQLPEIPAEVPSSLLQRRPDIASAERLAAAASAAIGVQVATYYPSLNLSAQGGLGGSALGQLISSSNPFWTLGATAAETIFDAGARHARVQAAKAAYDQAVANYRETVLTAFGQVEDNLAAQKVLGGEQVLTKQAMDAAVANEAITLNEYRAGTVDYTTVATAQATALATQNTELQTEAYRLTTAVDLIAALGGGWTAPTH
jgi:NodT family efflux transporter outer membrane factor (OMF) lipoprotein